MRIDQRTKKVIHLVSDILLSLALGACGIAFACSAYAIYTSAETGMFTYESIGRAFAGIAPLVYVTLFLVAVSALLSLLPRQEEKPRFRRDVRAVCRRLGARVDLENVGEEIRAKIVAERKRRKGLSILLVILVALEAVLPLFFLFNPATFPAVNGEYNDEVLAGILLYLCMLAPLLAFGILYAVLTSRSCIREEAALKDAIKAGARPPATPVAPANGLAFVSTFFVQNKRAIGATVRVSLLLVGALFIVLGIANGGMNDVLVKAVNICAECIGLG